MDIPFELSESLMSDDERPEQEDNSAEFNNVKEILSDTNMDDLSNNDISG